MRNKRSQPDTILQHLKERRAITSVEAFGLYGVTRLAAVVHRLRGRGLTIVSDEKPGVHGRYVEYRMVPTEARAAA